jgi:hypothetical protein
MNLIYSNIACWSIRKSRECEIILILIVYFGLEFMRWMSMMKSFQLFLRLLTSLKSISSRWCVIDFTSSDSSRDNYTSVIDINCLRKYVHNFLFSFLQWDTNILNYVCFVVWKQDTKNLVSWNLCCLKLNLFCLSFMYVESF